MRLTLSVAEVLVMTLGLVLARPATTQQMVLETGREVIDGAFESGDISQLHPVAAWYDPRVHGGSMLNRATETLSEPLNVIISADSSPDVLQEHGFVAFSRSLGLWNECANLHLGDPQWANLGDGNGWTVENYEMRESRLPYVGSCLETLIGGNHFRAWKQNGTLADSRAWFLAVSKEVDLRGGHKITENGYNLGRDMLVATALHGTRYRHRHWTTTVEWVEGLLKPGSEGINHGIAQDGRVAVLRVTEF